MGKAYGVRNLQKAVLGHCDPNAGTFFNKSWGKFSLGDPSFLSLGSPRAESSVESQEFAKAFAQQKGTLGTDSKALLWQLRPL